MLFHQIVFRKQIFCLSLKDFNTSAWESDACINFTITFLFVYVV
jgi:hypothetical protein